MPERMVSSSAFVKFKRSVERLPAFRVERIARNEGDVLLECFVEQIHREDPFRKRYPEEHAAFPGW